MLKFKVTNLLHFKLKNRQQKVNGSKNLIYKKVYCLRRKETRY